MNSHLRASIAYIAARLISASTVTGVFDQSQLRRVFLSGTVDRAVISAYDHERNCFITGAGDGTHYSLFHQGEGLHISLDIQEGAFWGHDYGRSTRFDGTVEGNAVTFHECELDRRFRYLL